MSPPDKFIREHIESTVNPIDADAWLVDGYGQAHGLSERATVGRGKEKSPTISVDRSSVSREHAELRFVDGQWIVRDLGSHNGTFVDQLRCPGRMVLRPKTVLRFGDVPLWFCTELASDPAAQASIANMTDTINGMVSYTITADGRPHLCVVGNNDGTSGGALLWRAAPTDDWTERELAPLEYQLMRRLCVAAIAEAGSPAAARGCVPTQQLARELPFQTRFADDNNVRQVVRRVRADLSTIGAEGTLASVPGRGYYIASTVTLGR